MWSEVALGCERERTRRVCAMVDGLLFVVPFGKAFSDLLFMNAARSRVGNRRPVACSVGRVVWQVGRGRKREWCFPSRAQVWRV